MKKWLNELLKENGTVSTMRVMSLLCVITACAVSMSAMLLKAELTGTAALVGVLLTPAYAGKVMQKGKEHVEAGNGPDTTK